ncbi:MAG: type IV pilin [Thermoplasmatales archaeon]|nr:type IV pilin [Thermoplasmatales archaeon]
MDNICKDKKAVSPVIGIILTLAITIVLAAVLFAWVSGYMSHSKGKQKSVALSIPEGVAGYPNVNKTKVISISDPADEKNVKWYISDGSDVSQADGVLGGPYPNISAAAEDAYGVAYIDNDENNMLSPYDLIIINETKIGVDIITGWSLRLSDLDGNTIGMVAFQ